MDAPAELVVHGLLFAPPVGRAAQDYGLLGLGMTGELDLDAFVDLAPAFRAGEFGGELLQLRLWRADDVAPPGCAQPRQIGGAGHAAIGDPDPANGTMAGLHGRHDRLQSLRIVGVAGEHFIAQRKAVEGHHKGDAHLLAIGTMIAGIAALCLRVGFRLALEIGAGDVVEQHFVLNREQLAATLRQMRFQRALVRQQMIEAAIKPILVDLFLAQLEQIAQRRAAVPVLAQCATRSTARRTAPQPAPQPSSTRRSCSLPDGSNRSQSSSSPRPAPQRKRQINIAELPRTLDAKRLQTHRRGHRNPVITVIEQRRLLGRADQMARQRPRLEAALLIQFAKMGNRLLNDTSADANAAHQAPIAMDLAVLPACRMTQIHAANHNRLAASEERPLVGTTRPIPLFDAP